MDPKGLCKRTLAGEIKNFTSVDQPYDRSENLEMHLRAGGVVWTRRWSR